MRNNSRFCCKNPYKRKRKRERKREKERKKGKKKRFHVFEKAGGRTQRRTFFQETWKCFSENMQMFFPKHLHVFFVSVKYF